MANNEVVQPVLDQEEDPVVVDPAENENDEQEDQEQEIEREIEQAENEDVFEDTVEVLPDNKPPIPQPKVKLPNLPVPTFSAYQKEDVTVFFDQLENIAEIYGWSDRLTLETALASLKANAHAWAMELDRSQKRDYKKFKSLAIETFKKSVPSWLRSKKMLEVQQRRGQDSQDFAAALRKVQLTLQAPSDAMLSAYLCGLEGKLAQMVAMHDPQSFEEAVRMAKKSEAIVTSSNEYSSRKSSNIRPRNRDNYDQSQARHGQSYSRPRQWQENRRPVVNEVHKGYTSQQPENDRQERYTPLYCSYHGECAHKTSECRQLKRQQRQGPLNGERAPVPAAGSGPRDWPVRKGANVQRRSQLN